MDKLEGTVSLLQQPKFMGFYNWSVSDNKIWGDANFASLFSIDKDHLIDGIPVERFLERISPDDRTRIAFAVHQAITTGEPYFESYEVVHPDGSTRKVAAFGRCLRNHEGIPSFFSGAAMDADPDRIAAHEDPLENLCRAAISLARQRDNKIALRYLESALFALG